MKGKIAELTPEFCSLPRLTDAAFSLDVWPAGPTAVSDAPAASDDTRATPTVTTFVELFRSRSMFSVRHSEGPAIQPRAPFEGVRFLDNDA
jgi:hypothetical protein